MGILRDWVLNPYACYSSPYYLLREKIKKWQPFRKVFENNQKKRGKPIFLWLSLLTDPEAGTGGGGKGGRFLPVHFTLAAAACSCYPLSSDNFVIVILFSSQSNRTLSPTEKPRASNHCPSNLICGTVWLNCFVFPYTVSFLLLFSIFPLCFRFPALNFKYAAADHD